MAVRENEILEGTINPEEPRVGQVLLFCVDDQDGRKRWRPFLVCSVFDGDSASGEVFPDWERDSKSKWALRIFQGLHKQNRSQWVSGARPGDEVGTWKFQDPAPEKGKRSKVIPLAQAKAMGR